MPNTFFYGNDKFTYSTTDSHGATQVGTVVVTVGNPPAPQVWGTIMLGLSSVYSPVTVDVSMNINMESIYTSVSIGTQPKNGSAKINGTTLTYTPNSNSNGTDSFQLLVNGPGGSTPLPVSVSLGGSGMGMGPGMSMPPMMMMGPMR